MAAGRGDENARAAVWRAWLRDPDDRRWELMAQWRGEQALAAAALAAATDPGQAAGARAVVGAFCVRRGIVPAGGAGQALLYILAGRPDQYHAADPDGSALAAAYQAASEPLRAALREAMTGIGRLDLVRVVATRGENGAPVTDAERAYLAAELARHRDWAALWRLALGFPLAGAVAAVRLIDPGWHPAGDDGRRLLARLVKAEPGAIRLTSGGPGEASSTTIRFEPPDEVSFRASFSPDGQRLAVVVRRRGEAYGTAICEVDVRRGELVARYDYPDENVQEVLHLGDEILATAWKPRPITPAGAVGLSLDRLAGGLRGARSEVPGKALVLRPYGDGFLTQRPQSTVSTGPGTTGAALLRYHNREGDVLGRALLQGGIRSDAQRHVVPPDTWPLAVDPGSMRVAASDGAGLAVFGPLGGQRLAGAKASGCVLRFVRPDELVVGNPGELAAWRIEGSQLVRRSVRESLWQSGQGDPPCPSEIAWIPARNQIAVLVHQRGAGAPWGIRYHDATTLAPVDVAGGLAGRPANALWSAPDGSAHASCDWQRVDVARIPNPPFGRPMAAMSPADLALVAGVLRAGVRPAAGRPALELLHACLEYRFGTDVIIGDIPAPTYGSDDIAVSAQAPER